MVLAIVGGAGMGGLFWLTTGSMGVAGILLGAVVGVPLGLVAGGVLSAVGSRVLVPYEGPVVAIVSVSGTAFCLVMMYLGLGLGFLAGAGSGEGEQSTGGPPLDWVFMTAPIAAALLSPWLVWWYVKRMETKPS